VKADKSVVAEILLGGEETEEKGKEAEGTVTVTSEDFQKQFRFFGWEMNER
jgi:hypothetical protein